MQEMGDQGRNIIDPFPERRQVDVNDIEPVIEIFPEFIIVDFILDNTVGRRQYSYFDV